MTGGSPPLRAAVLRGEGAGGRGSAERGRAGRFLIRRLFIDSDPAVSPSYSSWVPDGSIPAPRRQATTNDDSALWHCSPRAAVPVTSEAMVSPTTR